MSANQIWLGMKVYHKDHPDWGRGEVIGIEDIKAGRGRCRAKSFRVFFTRRIENCFANELRKTNGKKDVNRSEV